MATGSSRPLLHQLSHTPFYMFISVFVHLCTPVFAQEKHETTARNRTWTFYQPGRCAYHYTTEVLFAFWRHKTLFIKTKSNILTNFPETYWFKTSRSNAKWSFQFLFFSTFWLSFLFTFHAVYTNNAKEMSADK